jgi:ribosomal-protein-alanine N-acetyltransferase
MMHGLTLTLYEGADRRTQAAAMMVMTRAFDPAFGEAWTASQLAGVAAMPGTWLTVAQLDAATLGFALVRSIFDEAELLLLGVDPAWKRHGVGAALLEHCIDTARVRGIKSMFLEVRSSNTAIALYRKTGFEHVNTRRDYYRGADNQLYDAYSFRLEI